MKNEAFVPEARIFQSPPTVCRAVAGSDYSGQSAAETYINSPRTHCLSQPSVSLMYVHMLAVTDITAAHSVRQTVSLCLTLQ